MENKHIPSFETKIIDEDQGIVEHIVAVMGNVDLGYDRIHTGAFTKTINERGHKVRVLDQHKSGSVLDVIGKPLEMREIGRDALPPHVIAEYPEATGALLVKTQFLMNTPEGRGAFERIKSGAVGEWSFGYDALDKDFEKVKDKTVRNLRTVKLYEYSPVVWGMNPATTTISAKNADPTETETPSVKMPSTIFGFPVVLSDNLPSGDVVMGNFDLYAKDAKAGRVLSSRNIARIKNAIDELSAALAEAGVDDGKIGDEVAEMIGEAMIETENDGEEMSADKQAGPRDNAPTPADIMRAKLRLFETTLSLEM